VVTGAAGFIGSHLVERLLAAGLRVVGIDNLANGRLANLDSASAHPDFHFLQCDVAQDALDDAFAGVSWVFHLAALADIVPSIREPLRYHAANVDGTARVLEAARTAKVERFVYAASSSCYGLPDVFPTPELAPARPMYPYALTKYVGERYVLHWSQTYGIPSVSLRLFNVYGPRHRTSGAYGAVFGVFLAQKSAGQPFTVVGDGHQTRDFTFVTDVADAFVAAAQSDVTGEVFNVGSGGTYSINALVEMLGGPVTYIPKRPGEPDQTFADITKITRRLGWRPKMSFEQGVRIMLAGIGDFHDAPVWTPDTIATATRDWFAYLGPRRNEGAAA
jgi:UDP-glucose 4-epimerase